MKDDRKTEEKFRVFVPVGGKEVYYREPLSEGDEGKTLETRLFHVAPGTGFYRLVTQRDLDIKRQKIQAAEDQDIFIDVRISFKMAGGNRVKGSDADYFLTQEALKAKDMGDIDEAKNLRKLIKSKNSRARREFWETHHPILTYVANEDALKAEFNAIKSGKEHKAGPMESVINETLRKYLTHKPYYVIQNVNNPDAIEAECLNDGVTDQDVIAGYKKLGDQIKLELTKKFYKFGLQIVTFSYGDIVATKEFEEQQEKRKQLELEKGITKQENEINLMKAKNAQQVAKLQADQEAYKISATGAAEAGVLAQKADAVKDLDANQIFAMNGANATISNVNVNGLEPLARAGAAVATSFMGGAAPSKNKLADDMAAGFAKRNGNVISYNEVEKEEPDMFDDIKPEEPETPLDPNAEMFDEKQVEEEVTNVETPVVEEQVVAPETEEAVTTPVENVAEGFENNFDGMDYIEEVDPETVEQEAEKVKKIGSK